MRTSSYEVESSKKVFFSSSICNIFGDEKWRCQRYSINKWLCSYVSIDFVFSNCIKWDFSEIVVLLYNLQTLSAPSLTIWSLSKSTNTKRDLLILEISSHFLKEKKVLFWNILKETFGDGESGTCAFCLLHLKFIWKASQISTFLLFKKTAND